MRLTVSAISGVTLPSWRKASLLRVKALVTSSFGLLAFLPLGVSVPVEGTVLALLGFGGLFAGALLGLAQPGGKAVLAYSTVSQMGLVMGALGAALAAGLPGAKVLPAVAFYALAHGLAKGALFLSYGLAPACGRRSEERRVGKECRSRWSPYH